MCPNHTAIGKYTDLGAIPQHINSTNLLPDPQLTASSGKENTALSMSLFLGILYTSRATQNIVLSGISSQFEETFVCIR